MSTLDSKACPGCSQEYPLSQDICEECGHAFQPTTPAPVTPDVNDEGDNQSAFPAASIPAPPSLQPPVYPVPQRIPPPPQLQPPQSSGYSPPQYPQQLKEQDVQDKRSDVIQFAPGKFRASSPILATLILIGAGQMRNRQPGKGIVLLLSAIVLSLFTNGIGGIAVFVVAIVDAALIGGRLNRGEAVGKWQWF